MEDLNQEGRYKRRDSIEPTGNINFIVEEEGYDDVEESEEAPAYEPRQYDNPKHTEDKEVLPGLFQSDINRWKQQYEGVYLFTIKEAEFVVRTLTRFEYKEIVSMPDTDALMREEIMCEYCVLYPFGFTFSKMAEQKAGIPAVLSEMIMEHSGFTRDVQVAKL